MQKDYLPDFILHGWLSSSYGQKLGQIMETINAVQRRLYDIAENEDCRKLDLLKIGTVFQIFLIDVLASGKRPADITKKDWEEIAGKVLRHAVITDGQTYSVFVFSLYANYIDLSAEVLSKKIEKNRFLSIKSLASDIRLAAVNLENGDISEARYVEDCLWLSLEAMVKLLSSWLSGKCIPKDCPEYIRLADAISDIAFEYGRCVLYKKEQALLDAYIQNQYVLDGQLQSQYEEFLSELEEESKQFQLLIDQAFSPNIQDSLKQSAALARAAGVNEEEIMTSLEDINAFFMN